jgi:hypothetical protein
MKYLASSTAVKLMPYFRRFKLSRLDRKNKENLEIVRSIESLFYRSNINSYWHYYFIDLESDLYSAAYVDKTSDEKTYFLFVLSSLGEEIGYRGNDPYILYCKLEKLVSSAQFYRNILFGRGNSEFFFVLQQLMKSISHAGSFVKTKCAEEEYVKIINQSNVGISLPRTKKSFLEKLRKIEQELTTIYISANNLV